MSDLPNHWQGPPCRICGKPRASSAAWAECPEEGGEGLCWQPGGPYCQAPTREISVVGSSLVSVSSLAKLTEARVVAEIVAWLRDEARNDDVDASGFTARMAGMIADAIERREWKK